MYLVSVDLLCGHVEPLVEVLREVEGGVRQLGRDPGSLEVLRHLHRGEVGQKMSQGCESIPCSLLREHVCMLSGRVS